MFNTQRIEHIYRDVHSGKEVRLNLHTMRMWLASGNLIDLIYNVKPDEVYHLAAQSQVRVSFDLPEFAGDITGLGTMRILGAIRKSGIQTRFCQASSIEMLWP